MLEFKSFPGTVVVHLKKKKNVKGKNVHAESESSSTKQFDLELSVTIAGIASSHFAIGYANVQRIYRGREVFVSQEFSLAGKKADEPFDLDIGEHRFEFEFQLPSNLPASVKSTHGSIEYFVEASLGIPCSINKTAFAEFKVARRDDFSGCLELTIPRSISGQINARNLFDCSSAHRFQ
jgi:sporulation-control protein spo0M